MQSHRRLTAKEVASRLSTTGRITRTTGGWLTNCPCSIHKRGDRNPSLCVGDGAKGLVWSCYSGGDQMDVWNAMVDRIPELDNKRSDVVYTPATISKNNPVRYPSPTTSLTYDYLCEVRGISRETLEVFRIGEMDGKIAFPFYAGNTLRYCKLLDVHAERKKRWMATPAGATPSYFNIDAIDPDFPVIICEGEIDALSIHDAGLYNVVSVPNGAGSKKNDHPEYIADSWDMFSKATKIVLAGDMDEAGLELRERIARLYGKDRCWMVTWPEGCKDANDTLRTYGAEEVANCVNSAEPYPIRSLQTAKQYTDKVMDLYWNGRQRGLKVGYASVDPFYSVVTGELEIITGIPSSGKTNWIDQVNINLSERYGTKHAVCSFENPMEQHLGILAEKRDRASFAV